MTQPRREQFMEHNFFGDPLEPENAYVPIETCFVKDNGSIDWVTYAAFSDKEGFDTRCNTEKVKLLKDTRIARYGSEFGKYSAPVGTPYEKLSLPYIHNTVPYHEYIVLDDIEVMCIVKKGIIAPNFHTMGGGIQYLHHQSIAQEIENEALKEVYEWITK